MSSFLVGLLPCSLSCRSWAAFVMAASVESLLNTRAVRMVMRKVQARNAFLALKLTEILSRPELLKKALGAETPVEPIKAFERLAYEKVFDVFDPNKDGSITLSELTECLEVGLSRSTLPPGLILTSLPPCRALTSCRLQERKHPSRLSLETRPETHLISPTVLLA